MQIFGFNQFVWSEALEAQNITSKPAKKTFFWAKLLRSAGCSGRFSSAACVQLSDDPVPEFKKNGGAARQWV